MPENKINTGDAIDAAMGSIKPPPGWKAIIVFIEDKEKDADLRVRSTEDVTHWDVAGTITALSEMQAEDIDDALDSEPEGGDDGNDGEDEGGGEED